jgi:hypothetical protein
MVCPTALLLGRGDGGDLDRLSAWIQGTLYGDFLGGEWCRAFLVAQNIDRLAVPERVFVAAFYAVGDSLRVGAHVHAFVAARAHGVGYGAGEGLVSRKRQSGGGECDNYDPFLHGSILLFFCSI